jgi:hypothetical protein
MVETSFSGWLVKSEYEVNKRFDRAAAGFRLGACDCDYCRNFFSLKREIYPPEVLDLLGKIGVARPFEAEVVEYGLHGAEYLYHAWIPFFGAIKEVPQDNGEIDLFEVFPLHVPGMEGHQ